MTVHRCCSPRCPGYDYRASERAHPVETCGHSNLARDIGQLADELTAEFIGRAKREHSARADIEASCARQSRQLFVAGELLAMLAARCLARCRGDALCVYSTAAPCEFCGVRFGVLEAVLHPKQWSVDATDTVLRVAASTLRMINDMEEET
jgi:hypothetical protein